MSTRTLLCVEPDEAALSVITGTLEPYGFEIKNTTNGEQVVEWAKKKPADADVGVRRAQEGRLRHLQQDQAQRGAQGHPAHPDLGRGVAGEVRAAQDVQAARRRLHVQAARPPRAHAQGQRPGRARRAGDQRHAVAIVRDLHGYRRGVVGNRHRRGRHRRRVPAWPPRRRRGTRWRWKRRRRKPRAIPWETPCSTPCSTRRRTRPSTRSRFPRRSPWAATSTCARRFPAGA